MNRPFGWPHVILLSCAAMSALALADPGGPVALAATLWFLLVCPGMALSPLLPRVSGPSRLGLAVALSLAVDTAVAAAMLAAGSFSAAGGLLALEVVCLAGCAAQVRRWERWQPVTTVRLHT